MLPDDPQNWYWALMDLGTALKTSVKNPNQRSKHYVKQKAFEGSDRQIRGEVLRRMIILETDSWRTSREGCHALGSKIYVLVGERRKIGSEKATCRREHTIVYF